MNTQFTEWGTEMYDWRKATAEERQRILNERKLKGLPWHSLPHFEGKSNLYHICAACYEHKPIIGNKLDRMENFSDLLIEKLSILATRIYAWCVLPNHYHALLRIDQPLKYFIKELGKFHGRTSFNWNGEEECRGRKVWCNSIDRWIRNDSHFYTALNYIHHNPVKHNLAKKWGDWPFSSAGDFLEKVGREKAYEIWIAYPIKDYGAEWLNSDL